jgi:hypothetical protein
VREVFDAEDWVGVRARCDCGAALQVLRAFALTNLARSDERWAWKIGIEHISRNMGLIGGFDLGQGLQEPASTLG